MANLNIEMPDDLARSLEEFAAARCKSVQQLALEQLSSLVEAIPQPRVGSPAAILRAMHEPPHPSSADVDDLDAAIAAGRLPVRTRDPRDLLFLRSIAIYLLDTNVIGAPMPSGAPRPPWSWTQPSL